MHALHTKSSKHISQCCGRTLCPNIPILRAPAQISLQCKLLNAVWLWPPAKCFKTYLSTYDGECTIKIHNHHQYHSYQASIPKCSLFIIKGIMNILLLYLLKQQRTHTPRCIPWDMHSLLMSSRWHRVIGN